MNKAFLTVICGMLLLAGSVEREMSADEIARLVPRDVTGYVQIRNLQDGYAQLEPHLGRVFGAETGRDLLGFLRTTAMAGLDEMPREMRKEFLQILPAIDSLHLAVFEVSERRFEWLLIGGLRKGGDWKPFTNLFCKAMNIVEKEKVGEIPIVQTTIGTPYAFAWDGPVLTIATDVRWIREALGRMAGKGTAATMADHPHYRATMAGATFAVGAIFDTGRLFRQLSQGMSSHDRMALDEWDAVMGLTDLGTTTLRMAMMEGAGTLKGRIEPGNNSTALRMAVAALQPTEEKKTLRFLPADSLVAMTVTLTDAKKTFDGVIDAIDSRREDLVSHDMRTVKEAIAEEKKRTGGFGADDLLALIGKESALTVQLQRNNGEAALVCETANAAEMTAKTIQLAGRNKKLEVEPYRGYDIHYDKGGWLFHDNVSAVDGHWVYSPFGKEGIQSVIDAVKDHGSLADDKDFAAARAATPKKSAVMIATNLNQWLTLAEKEIRELPVKVAGKVQQPWDIFTLSPDGDALVFDYTGSGAPIAALLGMVGGFVALEDQLDGRRRMDKHRASHQPIEAKKPVPVLPGTEAEVRTTIEQAMQQLGDDDPTVREKATGKLKELGQSPAANPLVLAKIREAERSDDLEIRARAREIKQALGDYSSLSAEELKAKVKTILDLAIRGEEPRGESRTFLLSPQAQEELARIVLERASPDGQTTLALRFLAQSKMHSPTVATNLIAAMDRWGGETTYCMQIASILVEEHRAEVEPRVLKVLLRDSPLGWNTLDDIDRFLSPASIPKILPSLTDSSPQTRFNAGCCLDKLTGGAVHYNAFWDKARRAKAAEAYKVWWERQEKK